MEVTKHAKLMGHVMEKMNGVMQCGSCTPYLKYMTIVKVGEQNLVDMVELRNQLDNLFEYIHHELSVCDFKDHVRRFMKSEKTHLNK